MGVYVCEGTREQGEIIGVRCAVVILHVWQEEHRRYRGNAQNGSSWKHGHIHRSRPCATYLGRAFQSVHGQELPVKRTKENESPIDRFAGQT